MFEQPKTARSRRTVALPAFLQPYLQTQQRAQTTRRDQHGDAWADLDLIIDRGDGNPINPDTLSTGWARRLRQHELPKVRFHDLRHAHATLMLTKGVHPKIVSERLGHASIGITLDTYSHVLPSLQHEAAAAFDELFNPTNDTSVVGADDGGSSRCVVERSRIPTLLLRSFYSRKPRGTLFPKPRAQVRFLSGALAEPNLGRHRQTLASSRACGRKVNRSVATRSRRITSRKTRAIVSSRPKSCLNGS